MGTPLYSVICPFYNEKFCLVELYSRLTKVMRGLGSPYEILFINDGSDDDGDALLKVAIGKDPSASVVDMLRRGKTTATYRGLQAAGGDILITIDSDLQNPPEEIPKLIYLLGDYDMVLGIRRDRKDPFVKKVVGSIANRIRRMLLGDHIIDIGCALRVFRRAVSGSLAPREGMLRFFPAIVERQGFRIIQVPVEHNRRIYGISKYGILGRLWESIAGMPSALRTIRSNGRHKI
jgi:glycosyltransferase involved in cell wall biosynthesis